MEVWIVTPKGTTQKVENDFFIATRIQNSKKQLMGSKDLHRAECLSIINYS